MNAEDLEAIRHRHALYVAAFNDTAAARKAWCDKVAGTAIDCTGDVPALLVEVDRLQALVERQLGDCIGCAAEPDETCPHHGRTYTEWVDIASKVIGRQNDLTAERDGAQRECAELHDALDAARMVIDEALAKIRGRDQAAARDQVAAVVEAATSKPCGGFRWIGQSLAHCDGCGLPFWDHIYDRQQKPGTGPFDPDGWVLVPITPERAEAARRRWSTDPIPQPEGAPS